jgi:putative addiction module killer protein
MNYRIEQTDIFKAWHMGLRDLRAKAVVGRRLERAEAGNLGNVAPVGNGVSEMKIDIGPGYRLYFTVREHTIIFMPCGGNKPTQQADIGRAQKMAQEI